MVRVNKEQVTALLDTGSMVSTLCASLCQHLRLTVQPLDHLLTVQGAGGHKVPYNGRFKEDSTWDTVLSLLAKQQALVNTSELLGKLTIGKQLTLPPNGRMVVYGQTRVQAICQRMSVCLDGANGLPKGVLATPCINTLHPGRKRTKLPIELVNHSSKAVTS